MGNYTVSDNGTWRPSPASVVSDSDQDTGSSRRGVHGEKCRKCAITGESIPESKAVWNRGRWVAPWAVDDPGYKEARDRTVPPGEPVPTYGREDWSY